MNGIKTDEQDLLSFVKPDTMLGALAYLVIFVALAMLSSRALRAAVHAAMTRNGHLDRTSISFLQQICTALIWVLTVILYAHLIPALRSMGTALLAGASVASVVIGLAAQSTLGNLVAGIAITIYRPFRLGDTLQVATPTGNDIGIVELISLGYTTLRAPAGHLIVLPNSSAASQVILNLSATYAPWPISVTLRLSRNADQEAARRLALGVAGEIAGEKAVIGCFLTKMDGASITLELRLVAPDAAGRDALRSKLIADLARRFSEAQLDPGGADFPAFS
jgi:small conductance mechanosensitive channel